MDGISPVCHSITIATVLKAHKPRGALAARGMLPPGHTAKKCVDKSVASLIIIE
jgi:hypothetical protein